MIIYTLMFEDFVAQSAHQLAKQTPALPTAHHKTIAWTESI